MTNSAARLAWPLAISLALHLGAGWLFSPGIADFRVRNVKAVTLTVSLLSKEKFEPAPPAAREAPPAAAVPASVPAPAAPADAVGKPTQKARFLVPPDLTALEEIPVPYSGSVSLRLHVSALGTVDRVVVLKSDPLPKELLDGLLARFGNARLAPAQVEARPVASTLDLVVHYETGPELLPRDPARP